MTSKDISENIKNFLQSADLVYSKKDYTSATILYFKALFCTLDLIILQKLGKTPKDHSERFKILKDNFLELYEILDRLYSVYRETYSLKIEKDICDKVKENVESIIKKYKLFV
ncbi:MAG: hypothetical protein KKE23_03175 [Nanoarchaeota archaeon]|nr:hypothetical protein [Nanoarchaeota archaeon]